ncbi:MAG: ROK family protein, partial [Steroidobacteraceae bacterium]
MLGIDVGGTSIRAGLFVPRSGSVRHVRAIRTEASSGGRHTLARAAAVAREVVEAGGKSGLSVHKVGVGVPELVGPGGEIESRAVLPWRSTRVRKAFSECGDVTIASDVRAAALAEARLGAARGTPTFLYIGVGTGISSTLFIDGRPYFGAHGHAIAFASGPTCATQARDGSTVFAPLESCASGPALVRRAKALGYHAEDAVDVCRAAREQSGIARGVVEAAATELAAHVAILVNAL